MNILHKQNLYVASDFLKKEKKRSHLCNVFMSFWSDKSWVFKYLQINGSLFQIDCLQLVLLGLAQNWWFFSPHFSQCYLVILFSTFSSDDSLCYFGIPILSQYFRDISKSFWNQIFSPGFSHHNCKHMVFLQYGSSLFLVLSVYL